MSVTGKPVTQEEVARVAGVSRGAVSLALNGSPKISAAQREHIANTAAALGYRANANAARLARRHSLTIGIVMQVTDLALTATALRSAKERASSSGWATMLSTDVASHSEELAAVEELVAHRVDGVLLVGSRLPARDIRAIASTLPTVVVGRRVNGVDAVSVDDRLGGQMAMQHLFDLGHTSIAHVDGGTAPGARLRRSAYVASLEERGWAERQRVVAGGNQEAHGLAAGRRLFSSDTPPDAVFAFNDLVALGVMAAAQEQQLRIPEDVAIVGFDDIMISRLAYVSLTTIAQPNDLGSMAVQRLLGQIEGNSSPSWTLAAPTLVVRRSSSSATG